MQTLDFAVKVGAPRVVMHSGSVHYFFWSPEARLERWIKKMDIQANDLREHKVFRKRCDRVLKRIKRSAGPSIERIQESYSKLLPEVSERGLQLGIEIREGLEELPMDADFEGFLDAFGAEAPVGYWHDCGHAQLKHQFGIIDHAAHLEQLAPRLLGFHLHDVSPEGKDHQVPGTGVIDFKMIAGFIRPEHNLTLELSPALSTEQVRESRDYIVNLLG
jgi:sugar phosphate isomerase/epimerase